MKKLCGEWLQIVCGLIIFAMGVHLTIRAELGVGPWDCLGLGVSYHTPMNYGISMTLIALAVLAVDLLLKEKIGYGTVIDTLLTGNLVQLFNTVDRLPETQTVIAGVAVIAAGLVLMAVGQFFYMRAAQCCGPRDALLVALGKRLKRLPIGAVQVLLWGTVLLCGWLMGGPVGIGTVLITFGGGAVMQLVFSVIRFDPRQVDHQSALATTRRLAQLAAQRRTGRRG